MAVGEKIMEDAAADDVALGAHQNHDTTVYTGESWTAYTKISVRIIATPFFIRIGISLFWLVVKSGSANSPRHEGGGRRHRHPQPLKGQFYGLS